MKHKSDCIKLRRQLMSYLDGELDSASCDELEMHIAECVECQINVGTLRKTIELCKKAGSKNQLPGDIRERLFICLGMEDYL